MILGLDTSCYTTSLALLAEDGRLLLDKRRPLTVPPGALGLRQADALYQHFKVLPTCLEELLAGLPRGAIQLIAASNRPRPQAGSHMPVFEAAENFGRVLSLGFSVPLCLFSHQEGHIAAALWSLGLELNEPFLSVHLSGGTTELLLVQPTGMGYNIEILGSSDLAAGQFVDRIGVALGLPFPAGPHLEQLAQQATVRDLRLKTAVKGMDISFSGPESAAQRLLAQSVEPAELAWAVFFNIGRSLSKAIQTAARETGCTSVLLAGGVAANHQVKAQVQAECRGLKIRVVQPAYAGDNAVGTAALGRAWLLQGGNDGQ